MYPDPVTRIESSLSIAGSSYTTILYYSVFGPGRMPNATSTSCPLCRGKNRIRGKERVLRMYLGVPLTTQQLVIANHSDEHLEGFGF
jgi:hypothetical protein